MRRSDREIHDIDEMMEILQKGDVCHVALVDGNIPYIVALNYGCDRIGDQVALYFHAANSGKKLEVILANNAACFMVDTDHQLVRGEKGCDWGMKYRSVVGRGLVEIVEDPEDRNYGLDLLMKHYSGRTGFEYDERIFQVTVVLRIRVTELTGKKKE